MRSALRSRRELAIVAAVLLLPVPFLTASGLMVPLPSAVERALVSLTPGGDAESEPRRGPGADKVERELISAGTLGFEGGTAPRSAPPPAAGNGAAGSNDSSADKALTGEERMAPGGARTEQPAAPGSPGNETGPGGGTSPAPDTANRTVTASVSAGPGGADVDASESGIALSVDADQENDASADATATVPVPPLP